MRILPTSLASRASLQSLVHSCSLYSTTSQMKLSHRFVPRHEDANITDIKTLSDFVNTSRNLLAITGAGISTESGLPDYRSEGVGLYAKKDHKVTQHQTFVKSLKARKSYWARNFVGWPRWSQVLPNDAHKTLAKWEQKHKLYHIITQNVDQLHFKAGNSNVLELHGTNAIVQCLTCNYSIPRFSFQDTLVKLNPNLAKRPPEKALRPDGDVDLTEDDVDDFILPLCPKCEGSSLKPQIVFFGDNVPKHKVETCKRLVSESDSILVIGSSLQVFSGYRLILQAKEEGKRIGIINIGPTRGDHLADLKISTKAGDIMTKIKII